MGVMEGVMRMQELQSLMQHREAQNRESEARARALGLGEQGKQIKALLDAQKAAKEEDWQKQLAGLSGGGMGAAQPQQVPSMGESGGTRLEYSPYAKEIGVLDSQLQYWDQVGKLARKNGRIDDANKAADNATSLMEKRTKVLTEERNRRTEEKQQLAGSAGAMFNALSAGDIDSAQTTWNDLPQHMRDQIRVPMTMEGPKWDDPRTKARLDSYRQSLGGVSYQQSLANAAALSDERNKSEEHRKATEKRLEATQQSAEALKRDGLEIRREAAQNGETRAVENNAQQEKDRQVKEHGAVVLRNKWHDYRAAAEKMKPLEAKLDVYFDPKQPAAKRAMATPSLPEVSGLVDEFKRSVLGYNARDGSQKWSEGKVADMSSKVTTLIQYFKTIGSGTPRIPIGEDKGKLMGEMLEFIKDRHNTVQDIVAGDALNRADKLTTQLDVLDRRKDKLRSGAVDEIKAMYGPAAVAWEGLEGYLDRKTINQDYFTTEDGKYYLIAKKPGADKRGEFYKVPVEMFGGTQ